MARTLEPIVRRHPSIDATQMCAHVIDRPNPPVQRIVCWRVWIVDNGPVNTAKPELPLSVLHGRGLLRGHVLNLKVEDAPEFAFSEAGKCKPDQRPLGPTHEHGHSAAPQVA